MSEIDKSLLRLQIIQAQQQILQARRLRDLARAELTRTLRRMPAAWREPILREGAQQRGIPWEQVEPLLTQVTQEEQSG